MKKDNQKAMLAGFALLMIAFAVFYLWLFFMYKDTPTNELPDWINWLLN